MRIECTALAFIAGSGAAFDILEQNRISRELGATFAVFQQENLLLLAIQPLAIARNSPHKTRTLCAVRHHLCGT
jgi:hypothetical protein